MSYCTSPFHLTWAIKADKAKIRHVAGAGRHIVNETRSCKNTKNDSVPKPTEWRLRKIDSIPMYTCEAK